MPSPIRAQHVARTTETVSVGRQGWVGFEEFFEGSLYRWVHRTIDVFAQEFVELVVGLFVMIRVVSFGHKHRVECCSFPVHVENVKVLAPRDFFATAVPTLTLTHSSH